MVPNTSKQKIIEQINHSLLSKIKDIQKSLQDLSEALATEGKSSAGDKYETGRAMVHREMDQCKRQWAQWSDLLTRLNSISSDGLHHKAELGAIVETNSGSFFLFAGVGEYKVEGKSIFCLSPTSPLGQVFLGAKEGDCVTFRGKIYVIEVLI